MTTKLTNPALAAALGLAITFTLTACGGGGKTPLAKTETAASEPEAKTEDAGKPFFETDEISLTYADEAFFKKYKTYWSFVDKDREPLFAFIAKIPVKDFRWEDRKIDELLPQKPLVVSWTIVGVMSYFGFSYRDKNGQVNDFVGREGNYGGDPEEYDGPAFIVNQVPQENPAEKADGGAFTDSRDGRKYNTVKIGKQIWMAENLNYDAKGSKCYGNKPDNCDKYGRLYDWKTAKTSCPKGWYLPSEADWSDLMQFVNPSCPLIGDCANAGTKLKAVSGWNNDGNGTDNYGFAALPGGVGISASNFRDVGNGGLWWSASADPDAKTASRISIDIDGPDVHRSSSDKNFLFSIRCITDAK